MDLERLKIDRGTAAPARGRRRRGPALAPWIAIFALGGVLWLFRAPLLERVDRLRLPEVEVVRAVRSSARESSAVAGTAANGYIVARHRAALSADTPGRIVEMNVEEGSVVRAGDVVARLYAEEYEAAVRQAEANVDAARAALGRAEAETAAARTRLEELAASADAARARLAEAEAGLELAKKSFARSEKLVAENVVSVERLDADRAELDRSRARVTAAKADVGQATAAVATGESDLAVARARVAETRTQVPVLEAAAALARATLSKTEVRAPFDGIVVLKDAEIGEVVSPNAQGAQSRGSVVTMVDFESLEVQVDVPETSLAAVRIDAPAEIFLDAFPERRYTGRVLRIWPTANRQKATVEVRVGIAEPDELLRPEMGARVVFVAERAEPALADGPRRGGADDGVSGADAPAGGTSGEAYASRGAGGASVAGGPASPGGAAVAGPVQRVLLPTACLVRVEGRTGAFVLERDVARFVPLELGADSGGRVVVLAGLEGGERVVSNPPPSLDDGERVRVKDET